MAAVFPSRGPTDESCWQLDVGEEACPQVKLYVEMTNRMLRTPPFQGTSYAALLTILARWGLSVHALFDDDNNRNAHHRPVGQYSATPVRVVIGAPAAETVDEAVTQSMAEVWEEEDREHEEDEDEGDRAMLGTEDTEESDVGDEAEGGGEGERQGEGEGDVEQCTECMALDLMALPSPARAA